jgi:hypothetical protein
MPFTFSHPAVVLPLTKLKGFSATALIIGSMAPDFEYFIRMRLYGTFSHSFPGIFLFDFPLVLLLAFVYHNWMRDGLLNNLPLVFRKRLIGYQNFNWNAYFKNNIVGITLSALIGIVSHIVWDGFTHPSGFVVEAISALRSSIGFAGFRVQIFKFLQHASTLVGFAVVVYWVIKLHPAKAVAKKNITAYWLWAGSICLGITAIRFFVGLNLAEYKHLIATVIPAAMLGVLCASILTSKNKQVIN